MRRIWIGLLIFLIFFIALGFATFKLGLGHFVAKCIEDLENTNLYIHHSQLVSLIVVGLFVIIFSVLGFFLAKKRGRDRFTWTILCFFFNFWAFIILLLLPASDVSKKGKN